MTDAATLAVQAENTEQWPSVVAGVPLIPKVTEEKLLNAAHRMPPITTIKTAAGATELVRLLNLLAKDAETERKSITTHIDNAKKAAQAVYTARIGRLEKAIAYVNGCINTWRQAEDAKTAAAAKVAQEAAEKEAADRAAELERQAEAARKAGDADAAEQLRAQADQALQEGIETPPAPVVTLGTIRGDYGGTSFERNNPAPRLADIRQVPEQYLVPPEDRVDWPKVRTAMREARKKKSRDFAIAGLDLQWESTNVAR